MMLVHAKPKITMKNGIKSSALVKRKKSWRQIYGVTLLLLSSLSVQAATLTSVVNRNQVGLNETMMLLVTYDEQVDASELDLSVLQQDFEVLGVSPNSSSSLSIVNGQTNRDSRTSWRVTLLPRRQGELQIPALTLDGARSQPITVNVTALPQESQNEIPLSADLRVSTTEIFPNQQALVTITISAASNVGNLNGPALEVDGAELELLDQSQEQTISNGIARQVVTLRYALFANTPGALTIPPLTYSGSEGGGASIFSNRGRQVIARTPSRSINVKPLPKNAPQPWLVADRVEIESEWLGETDTLRVGEPLTRRVTIRANGQRAEALPPLLGPSQSSEFQTYQDQAQLETIKQKSGLLGVRRESEAIIANASGTLELPEQSVRYLNARTGQIETAVLPASTIEVLPALVSNNPEPSTPLSSTVDNGQVQEGLGSMSLKPSGIWFWLSVALALLCLAQAIALIVLFKRLPRSNNNETRADTSESDYWKALLKASKQLNSNLEGPPEQVLQNVAALRNALTKWASTLFEKPLSLAQLAEQLPNGAAQEMTNIDRLAFGSDNTQLESLSTSGIDTLRQGLNALRREQLLAKQKLSSRISQPGSLPELYPSGN